MPPRLWYKQRLVMTQNSTQTVNQVVTVNLPEATTVKNENSTGEESLMKHQTTSGTSLHSSTRQNYHPENGTCQT